MFRSARIKLTTWYLLIIMLISASFSMVMYRMITSELDRVEAIQRIRIERRIVDERWNFSFPGGINNPQHPFFFDPALVEETKRRLIVVLVLVNSGILGASAIAGYILAGRTLKPIKEMVDEQSRFISDASHELRTPLTSLKSEIEVNLRDKKLNLSQAKRLLESNLEEVNSLQVLSDDLIKLTKYQRGHNGLEMGGVSLLEIIGEAIRKTAILAKSKNIDVVNEIKDIGLKGNEQTLVELFVIFLDNAIKYSPEKTRITLTARRADSHVLINIADQGIGIAEADIPYLFDRFFRADKSRARANADGYGLGLAIARQIVDGHNGSIRVQSKLNKGTTFTVQIPVKHKRKIL